MIDTITIDSITMFHKRIMALKISNFLGEISIAPIV